MQLETEFPRLVDVIGIDLDFIVDGMRLWLQQQQCCRGQLCA
jgi:hypothetical protein